VSTPELSQSIMSSNIGFPAPRLRISAADACANMAQLSSDQAPQVNAKRTTTCFTSQGRIGQPYICLLHSSAVFVSFRTHTPQSAPRRLIELWLGERRLQ